MKSKVYVLICSIKVAVCHKVLSLVGCRTNLTCHRRTHSVSLHVITSKNADIRTIKNGWYTGILLGL